MQAIYEAVLLVPTEPHQATLRLNRLFRTDSHFIATFAQLMLEYYARTSPSNAKQYDEYQIMMRQLATLLDRFLGLSLPPKNKACTLNVEDIFISMLQILSSPDISLASKKPLVHSLTSLITCIGLKGQRLLNTLEGLVTSGAGSSVFVVLEALLDSSLYDSEKLRSIQVTYRELYWLANQELSQMVRYHHQNRMEGDGPPSPGDHFFQMLKDTEYILSVIIRLISLPYRKLKVNNSQFSLSELLSKILMEGELAIYLSRLLKIEGELLAAMGMNPFGLRLVVLCSLRKEQQVVVNRIKAKCLWTLRLILSLTDKDFNICHTDKLLMHQLPSLAHLLLQQLLICSNPQVMSQLKSELQANFLLAAIFELLAEVVRFRDLREVFEGLSVEQIIRLSLAHLSIGTDESQTFEREPENYTTLLLYALHRDDLNDDLNDEEQQSYEGAIGQFAVKRQIGGFLWAVGRVIEGFQSILIEVCLDVIKLECECRPKRRPDYDRMFIQKYGLDPSILGCCKLSNSLICLALLLERSDGQLQRRKGIKAILDTVRLQQLEPIQLGRVFACLAMHCTYFHIPQIQNRYYYIIQEAIRAGRSDSALSRLSYYFLEKVMTHNKDPDQSHLTFCQKLLQEIFAQLPQVTHVFACETIEQVLLSPEMLPLFNLDILCNCLQNLLASLRLSFSTDCSHIQLPSKHLQLYKDVLELGIKLVQKQQELPYPQYKNHLQLYHQTASRVISPAIINTIIYMVNSKTVDLEEEHLLFMFCRISCLLLSSQSLGQGEQLLLEKLALTCLNRQIEFESFLKKGTFQLLWQIVRVRGLLLGNSQLQVIIQWMRRIYYTSQTNLNRVCLIMQQFYCMAAFSPFCTINLYVFFSPIAELLKHKLLDALFKITQLLHEISTEQDQDRRKINEISLNLRPEAEQSFNPITICRLYTLVLMDPKLDPAALRSIHQPMQKRSCPLPAYDLGMQVLALRELVKRSKKLGVVECFRFTTSLLHSHAMPGNIPSTFATEEEKQIRQMVQPLRPALANPDPYHSFAQLVEELLHKHEVIFNDQGVPVQFMEVDIIDYLKSDPQLIRLVRKVCCVRRVNQQTRSIFRVSRD